MTAKDFCDMLDTTEPLLTFRGYDYQICALHGRFLAGLADNEDEDRWFDSKEELLDNWVIQGKRLRDILPELDF